MDQIILGDCIEALNAMPEKSIDLIFADPPYNLQLQETLWRPNMTRVEGVADEWDQFSGLEEYDHFTRQWLMACRRVLKDTGTLWVIGSYHNIYRVGAILLELLVAGVCFQVWARSEPRRLLGRLLMVLLVNLLSLPMVWLFFPTLGQLQHFDSRNLGFFIVLAVGLFTALLIALYRSQGKARRMPIILTILASRHLVCVTWQCSSWGMAAIRPCMCGVCPPTR